MDRGRASKILLCKSANAIHLFLSLESKLTNLTLLYHLTLTGCQLSKRTKWKILKERKARNYQARSQNHEVQVNQQLIKETLRQIHLPWVQKTSLSIMLLVNKIGFLILRNVWKDYEIEWEMFWRNMQLKWILNHSLKHIYDSTRPTPNWRGGGSANVPKKTAKSYRSDGKIWIGNHELRSRFLQIY